MVMPHSDPSDFIGTEIFYGGTDNRYLAFIRRGLAFNFEAGGLDARMMKGKYHQGDMP